MGDKSDDCIRLIDACKPVVAILGIVTVELYALSKGINGVALSASIACISGLGGYYLKIMREKIDERRCKRWKKGD